MARVVADGFTSFPQYIDSTMFSAMKACPRSFYNRYCRKLSYSEQSIHLIAGGAYAKGLEVLRKQCYQHQVPEEEALIDAVIASLAHYGDFDCEKHSKSPWGIVRALVDYVREYGIYTDKLIPHKRDGQYCIEERFQMPTGITNPDTNEEIMFVGSLDMLADFNNGVFILDDKTTGALGGQWGMQWDMRGQFLGYGHAMRELYGHNVKGAIIRGVGLYKTMIKHQEVMVQLPKWKTDLWWEEFKTTVEHVRLMYIHREFGYNFGDSCNTYTGCSFKNMCNVQNEEAIVPEYNRKVWRPEIGKEEILQLADSETELEDALANAFGMRT